ncbi:MAG: hypothetical protein GX974_06680 [Clostridiales bacterium]|nr:hypothetical protein [Clostridiales bacterium]
MGGIGLVEQDIQFTLAFNPMTSTEAAKAVFIIFVCPDISLSLTINFDSGAILL